MADKILKSFDVWIGAQGVKSRTRLRSVDNISLEGIERLRELTLELAIRGKLTPRVNGVESGKVLVKKLKAHKNNKNEIGKERTLNPIRADEIPFDIPENWEWCRLGDIITMHYGESLTKSQCIIDAPYPVFGSNGIVGYFDKFLTEKRVIVIGRKGSAGALNISEKPSWTTDVAYYVEESQFIDFKFEYFLLKSLHLENLGKGIKPGVNRNEAYVLPVSIPPLAEQHRIVAKVEELMALCDELEKQETHHLKSHALLVETLLGTLTQAKDAKEFQQAWKTLAQHFDDLFTTEDSIDQLKQAILQLAVMGKLVPQDPKDEPASVLLERIRKEKERLVEDGKFKRQKGLANLSDDEKLFEVPFGWQWCRLQSLVYLLGDGLHGTPNYTPDTKYYFVNGNNLRNGEIVINPDTKTVSRDEMLKHKKELTENAVLVSINGTLGNVAFYRGEEIMLGKSACYFNLSPSVSKLFIRKIIESNYFKNYAFDKATGTTIKNLGLKAMNEFPICLPPINEQQRIVSKVNELFALCDRLKERITEAQKVANQMAHSILEYV